MDRVQPSQTEGLVLGSLTFFVWQVVHAIPFLEIPETFGWEPIVMYEGVASGIIVVLYKLLAVVGVFVAVGRILQEREAHSGDSDADED